MILYAESSAVLSWLLEESTADEVRTCLSRASLVVTSTLTVLECDRALLRASFLGLLTDRDAGRLASKLETTVATWSVLELDAPVWERGRRPLPGEPLRALDALHLARVLTGRSSIPELSLLSLDHRLRRAASEADISVLPAAEGVVSELLERYAHD